MWCLALHHKSKYHIFYYERLKYNKLQIGIVTLVDLLTCTFFSSRRLAKNKRNTYWNRKKIGTKNIVFRTQVDSKNIVFRTHVDSKNIVFRTQVDSKKEH